MALEYKPFVRRPFKVEAIEVTAENIKELAKGIGQLKYNEDDGTPYIVVDRKKVPNIYRIMIGYYITKVENKTRAYSANSFAAQFTESTEQNEAWVDFMNAPSHNIEDAEEAQVS